MTEAKDLDVWKTFAEPVCYAAHQKFERTENKNIPEGANYEWFKVNVGALRKHLFGFKPKAIRRFTIEPLSDKSTQGYFCLSVWVLQMLPNCLRFHQIP